MKLQSITMPQDEAKEKWSAQCELIRETPNHSPYDEVMKKCYYAMSQGNKILDLVQIMKHVPFNELGQPRLGIVRADADTAYFQKRYHGAGMFSNTLPRNWGEKGDRIYLPRGTFPLWTNYTGWNVNAPISTVLKTEPPVIPANIAKGRNLARYHVLWEVDYWTDIPPQDPLLLRRLAPTIFEVLEEWELTDLEYAVSLSLTL